MGYVLAIDAGTTGVRAAVFDAEGRSVASAYRELAMQFPHPGWVEQDAQALWDATAEVAQQAVSSAGVAAGAIVGVGVTNQRSSVVAWSASDLSPLSPIITWQDTRTAERCRELEQQGFFVSPSLAVTKAEWILRNIAAAREAAEGRRLRLGTVDSWLAARLTGGLHVTDHSNASATGFYDHLTKDWDTRLLDAVGIVPEWMPRIVDSSTVLEHASAGIAGLNAPLGGICGDQQGSLYGLGCRVAGQVKCSFGTAAMVDANSGEGLAVGGEGTYPLVAWALDGTTSYCIEGSVITSGAAVQWLRDALGVIDTASEIDALAAQALESGGVWIIPAFQGLGTPWARGESRALIGGLSRGAGKAQLARAMLDGLAQRVTDVAQAVWHGSEQPDCLRADGGASRSDLLMQRQADLLGIPVERSGESDGAALGVAALAARAVGLSADDGFGRWQAERTFEPAIGQDQRRRDRDAWRERIERLIASEIL